MACSNSIIIPWDSNLKLARRFLFDSRGEKLVLSRGCLRLRCIIINFAEAIKEVGILCSNVKTFYDLDSFTQVWNEIAKCKLVKQ